MIWIIVILILIIICIKAKTEIVEIEHINSINQVRKEFMERNNIPSITVVIYCIKENNNEIEEEIRIWQENNFLNFISANYDTNNMKLKNKLSIPLENIKYCNRFGDYRVDNMAECGEVVAGVFGSVSVGKKKITTTNTELDERNTYLNYLENNELKYISFNSEAYNVLQKMCPLKEY